MSYCFQLHRIPKKVGMHQGLDAKVVQENVVEDDEAVV